MPGETEAHLLLKRLALAWAAERGYRAAACEVSIPMLQMRIDVAAFRADRKRSPGAVALFECKQSVSDFRNHGRSEAKIRERLVKLAERRAMVEEWLQMRTPNLRNGDTLFPEYDTWAFEQADYQPYRKLLEEIARLTLRLSQNTKFDQLARAACANLHYVVAEPEVVPIEEVPPAWGLLLRRDAKLELIRRPVWQDPTPARRAMMTERIAVAATREVWRQHGVTWEFEERRGY